MEAAAVVAYLVEWIRKKVGEAGAVGTVVGISGGIDSAVVAGLCKRAFPEKCLGVIMPCHSNPMDAQHAAMAARAFAVEAVRVDLDQVYDTLLTALQAGDGEGLATANLKPRLRMTTLYYYANKYNYLVAGTGNASEIAIGYFTKYGDGGVDIEPIGNLVKGKVREVARYLGVPGAIIAKPPSAGLWSGQTDEGEMGFTYEELDRCLLTGAAPPHMEDRLKDLHQRSEHKRQAPPVPPNL